MNYQFPICISRIPLVGLLDLLLRMLTLLASYLLGSSEQKYLPCTLFFLQSSLHENVVFSVCTRMGNATYIIYHVGIPFLIWTPDNISGLTSVVIWLSRWEVIKKISGNFLRGRGGQNNFGVKANFWGRHHF